MCWRTQMIVQRNIDTSHGDKEESNLIIHKESKGIETRGGFPNSNFGEYENVFIVDDSSELAQKAEQYSPFMDFVLDENGELIDITPKEKPSEPPQSPTEAERIRALEETVNFLLGL